MMRNTSKVLGIIGGIIALLLALILIIVSLNFRGPDTPWLGEDTTAAGEVQIDSGIVGEIACLITGGLAFIAGVLGMVGAFIVNRKNVASGVMMIIAAVLSLFSYYNVVSMILFVVGAVFALKRLRRAAAPQQP